MTQAWYDDVKNRYFGERDDLLRVGKRNPTGDAPETDAHCEPEEPDFPSPHIPSYWRETSDGVAKETAKEEQECEMGSECEPARAFLRKTITAALSPKSVTSLEEQNRQLCETNDKLCAEIHAAMDNIKVLNDRLAESERGYSKLSDDLKKMRSDVDSLGTFEYVRRLERLRKEVADLRAGKNSPEESDDRVSANLLWTGPPLEGSRPSRGPSNEWFKSSGHYYKKKEKSTFAMEAAQDEESAPDPTCV